MKIPQEIRAAINEIARQFGKGGKAAAQNMTPEERKARAKRASQAAAEKQTTKRLAREGIRRDKKASKGK
jgi:hypothetical protein